MSTNFGAHEDATFSTKRGSNSINSHYRPIVSNNNSNQNFIQGPGNILNYNSKITYIGNSDALLELVSTKSAASWLRGLLT